MRLAAVACALAIVLFVGAVGAVVSQRSSVPMASPSPAQAASTEEQARAVITTLEERDASPTDASAAQPPSSPEATQSSPPTIIAENTRGVAPAQVPTPTPPTAAASPAAPAPPPAPHVAASCPGNPDALGVSRVVEIDTTGGPGFGFEHFKAHDFLREGEIVLTFDDGPWPKNTPAVLAALQRTAPRRSFSRSVSTPRTSLAYSSRWLRPDMRSARIPGVTRICPRQRGTA